MEINIHELNIFYFRTIWFEQTYNPVFQLQQYHSILVPEWCCTSGVLAWESHWHQLCVWPTIVQVMGFNSKKNAWNIWYILKCTNEGAFSHERKGMIFNTDLWIIDNVTNLWGCMTCTFTVIENAFFKLAKNIWRLNQVWSL